MTQNTLLTMQSVEAIRKALKEAPPPDPAKRQVTKQEAVAELREEITALRNKGYALEDIAELLKGGGLDITPPTLKGYLQRSKRGPVPARKPRQKTK